MEDGLAVTDYRRGASDEGPAGAAPLHRATRTGSSGSTRGSGPSPAYRERGGRGGRRLLDLDVPGGFLVQWLVIGLAVLLVAMLVAIVADLALWGGKVHPGVRVSGVDVGGMTPAQASAKLTAQLTPRYSQPVTVRFEDKTWSVAPAELGAQPDAAASVRTALAFGKGGSWAGDTFARLAAYAVPADLVASSTVDPARFAAKLDDVADGVRLPTYDALVAVKAGEFVVTPPRAGRELDRAAAESAVLAALPRTAPRVVTVTASRHDAGVTEASARAAAEVARGMAAGSATITYGAKRWQLGPADIAGSLSFRVVPAGHEKDPASLVPQALDSDPPATSSAEATGPVGLGVTFDPAKLGALLGPKVGGLGRPAKDARFVVSSGAVSVAPHQVGLGPDMRSLARDLDAKLEKQPAQVAVVTLRLGQTLPKLTTEKARAMGIRKRLSTFSTDFDSGNKPRVNNIRTLANAIDGSLVAPGATWSLNGQVGERTADKGYKEANAIVNGKLVPQFGGGICQVATTVFNAIFFSGVPVVERQNHSFYISHYPKGRDAAVTWGGADLKFRNDTGKWILIKTSTGSGSVTVSLYGTDTGYRVDYKTGELIRTGGFPTEATPDPRLPVGTKVVRDGGLPSYKVTVTRTVTKGGSVVRRDVFVSNYRPKVEVVLVGSMPIVKPPPSVPTSPAPSN
jgi:vancomycin resistance protein YoaR